MSESHENEPSGPRGRLGSDPFERLPPGSVPNDLNGKPKDRRGLSEENLQAQGLNDPRELRHPIVIETINGSVLSRNATSGKRAIPIVETGGVADRQGDVVRLAPRIGKARNGDQVIGTKPGLIRGTTADKEPGRRVQPTKKVEGASNNGGTHRVISGRVIDQQKRQTHGRHLIKETSLIDSRIVALTTDQTALQLLDTKVR